MDELLQFDEIPQAEEMIMITGWRQWADAGSVSSALPEFLIELLDARKIGELRDGGFYLFQIPGAHHLLRPTIRLEDGYRQSFEEPRNEFFYAGNKERGIVIFLGDEPHMNVSHYADAFFAAADTLKVTQVAGVAGVYGPVPYDRDRQISVIYSLPRMKTLLEEFAVNFSNYEGGSSIDSYLVSKAEEHDVPYTAFYAFVPAYDFAPSASAPQGIRIENDYKSWYDILHRFNHLYDLDLELSDLLRHADELIDTIDAQVEELAEEMPQLKIHTYLEKIGEEFTELSFMPLDDVWEEELKNLFDEGDE